MGRAMGPGRVVVEPRRMGGVFLAGLILDVRRQSPQGRVANDLGGFDFPDPGDIFHRAEFFDHTDIDNNQPGGRRQCVPSSTGI